MVTLTDIAADKVRGFLSSQESEGEVGLRVFEYEGIRLIVDPASLRYVDGSQVDFTESMMGSGFEVNNPNVTASCGCGSSFRIADEEPSCGSAV
jgi:iron-sulfur cluster assembly protein